MESLEQIVATLRKQQGLLETLGKDILLYADQSEVAGHRYGFVYDEVLGSINLHNCRELTLIRAERAKTLGQTYLGLDDTLTAVVDNKGYEKVTPPQLILPLEGTDVVSVLAHNGYNVLQSLNANVRTLFSEDHSSYPGQGYALAWHSLFSALTFSTETADQEKKIRVLVEGLQDAFDYVTSIVSAHSLAFRNIFEGYQEGPQLEGNRAYAFEGNVERFCHRTEKVILSSLLLSS